METSQQTVRNYAAMTKELDELKALFDKKVMSEAEYINQRDKIEQDIYDYKYKKTGFKNYIKTKNINIVKSLLNIFATLFVLIGLIFTILPIEIFGLVAIGMGIILAGVSIFLYKEKKKSFSKYILFAALAIAIIACGKLLFVKDEVVKDTQFEQTKQKSQQEDLKELEGL